MPRDYTGPEDPDGENVGEEKPSDTRLSFRTAMIAYAVIIVLCLATLHGDALYLALIIVGAIALKTWLARVKSRLD